VFDTRDGSAKTRLETKGGSRARHSKGGSNPGVRTLAVPYFESGFPYGDDQWISQIGTAWAAMALTVTDSPTLTARSAAPPAEVAAADR